MSRIAQLSRLRFAQQAKRDTSLKDFAIHRTWFAARATSRMLESMVVGARAELARVPKLKSHGSNFLRKVSALVAAGSQDCHCADCEAAMSPGAYLADLLDFALTHLVKAGAPIDLAALEAILLQPIGELPALCSATEERVSQARLCIEVIRRALGDPGGASLQLRDAEATYRTAAYGALLENIGTSYTELHLAKSETADAKQALTDRLGIAETHLPELTLDASDATSLTEVRLEEIFGLRQTNAPDPLAPLQQPPKLLEWRREKLFQIWSAQDHPLSWTLVDPLTIDPATAPAWLKSPPVIDPDVIGPDDFRDLTPKANQGDPDKPFDLWLERRKFVDDQLKAFHAAGTAANPPNRFQVLLDQLNGQMTYRGTAQQKPWQNPTAITDLLALRDGLRAASDPKTKRKELAETRYLEPENLERLIELGIKDKESVANPSNAALALSTSEWDEVRSILMQVQKRSLAAVWQTEENATGFEGGHYWISQREPEAGHWPPEDLVNPLIDPELVRLADLPETISGDRAIKHWKRRQAQFLSERDVIKHKRELSGFDEMLKYALGEPNPGDVVPHIGQDAAHPFRELFEKLDSNDAGQILNARSLIEGDLKLKEEALRRLVEIKKKDASLGQQPTVAEYEEIYSLLLPAHKQKHLYSRWRQQEAGDSLTSDRYWEVRKARLPRWRATIEQRARWQAVLRSYLSPVIVDPDIIIPGEIVDPVSGTPAFDLWDARRVELDQHFRNLSQLPTDASGYDQRLRASLAFDRTGLDKLDQQRSEGVNIGPRLSQLNLPPDGFNELLRISNLLKAGTSPLQSDWENVNNILTAVWKHNQFPRWHREERDKGVILSSIHFRLPVVDPLVFPPPQAPDLPSWRATQALRREWLRTLEDRIELGRALEEALRSAVSATEAVCLPQLRDALLQLPPPPPAPPSSPLERARAFAATHLIETQNAGCALTTRVAQAIESVQGLLFAARSGQYDRTARLSVDNVVFDDAWPVIGSYETWRANMMAYLYPENLLLPTIRTWRTTAFDELAKALREAPRLDAQSACRVANGYEGYFRDITSLDIQATCEAMTRINEGRCRAATCQSRTLFYTFARGGATGSIYWSAYDPANGTDYAQTPWAAIQEVTNVLEIVGAVPYRVADKERYIYLFLRTRERATQKLAYLRYDLENQKWEGEPVEIELSIDGEDAVVDFQAVVLQRPGEGQPPFIGIRLANGKVFGRSLNLDGSGWEETAWSPLFVPHASAQFETLDAIIGDDRQNHCLIATGVRQRSADGSPSLGMYYELRGEGRQDGTWRYAGICRPGGFRGALLSSNGKHIITFASFSIIPSIPERTMARKINFRDAMARTKTIATAHDLNEWLWDIAGVDLRDVIVNDDGRSLFDVIDDGDGSFKISNRLLDSSRARISNELPSLIIRHIFISHVARHVRGPTSTEIRLSYQLNEGLRLARVSLSDSEIQLNDLSVVAPVGVRPRSITADLTSAQRQDRHDRMEEAYQENAAAPKLILEYLDEAYYFVPIQIALELHARGQYQAALDWHRTVFDYEASLPNRKIFVGLEHEAVEDDSDPNHWVLERGDRWLLDPTNPHGVAITRPNSYTRFTLMSLVRCLLDYADSEFTRDTVETVPRARRLYRTALELLDLEELRTGTTECEDILAMLDIEVRERHIGRSRVWSGRWSGILARTRAITNSPHVAQFAERTRRILANRRGNLGEKLSLIDRRLQRILGTEGRTVPEAQRYRRAEIRGAGGTGRLARRKRGSESRYVRDRFRGF